MDSTVKNYANLLKIAIKSTDNYLGILSQVREAKLLPQTALQEFVFHLKNAHDSLVVLGVASEHETYMNEVIDEIMSFKNSPVKENINFSNFLKESEETFSDEEVNLMVRDLDWEDIYDLYDQDELVYDPEPEEVEEKISAQSRIRRSQAMKRRTPRLTIARNLKLRRTSSIDVLKKRAVNAARRSVYKKLLMGRNKANLSAGEKDMLERRMKNFKYMQNTIAIKMLPKLKTIEQARLAHRTNRK